MPEIVVHHLENSRSLRLVWMLEELGLDYTIRAYARNPKTLRAPPELAEVHPLGKAPVVTIDGVVHAESGAILEHLVDAFGEGRFRPTDPDLLRRYRFFLHYAEGSLMPPLLVKLILHQIRKAKVPFFIKPITKQIANKVDGSYAQPEVDKHLAFLEQSLVEHPWFAGPELSAADVQMSYPIEALSIRGDLDGFPKIRGFLERVEGREAYKRAIERAGRNTIPG